MDIAKNTAHPEIENPKKSISGKLKIASKSEGRGWGFARFPGGPAQLGS
jgi:hypothetical protein